MAPRPPARDLARRLARAVSPPRRLSALLAIGATAILVAATPLSAAAHDRDDGFVQTNLVSDIPGMAEITDASLVNAWGMSMGPSTPVWVSDNGADVTTLYRGGPGTVAKAPLTVSIPDGAPTGQVFNPTSDFMVSAGGAMAPALFIFASENGSIDAWSPGVPPPAPSTMAQSMVTVPHAVYKGLALATTPMGDFLYAANFHSGRIDVFNGSFQKQHWDGAFRDPRIPDGYAPFNIQNLGGRLYVTYAKQDAARHDDVAGPGHGFVDVYDLRGHLIRRLVTRGALNSPWGLAIAPAGFGDLAGDLLVGNFGDGRIHAYNPWTGAFKGTLRAPSGRAIVIDGLWGLTFGNGVAATPTTLIFSAGPDGESHGLFGTLMPAGADMDH